MLADIDEDTVDFVRNYDNERREPVALPARFPNLLANGANGIAVGMATNIPPHNLGELIDACIALIADPDMSVEALADIVPGPDFPTGGLIMGKQACRAALMRGRGSVLMRARSTVEEIRKDREAIIVTEIPYQVNKAAMIEKIAELVRDKRVEGIADLRDESDRDGVRVVIELKRDAMAEIVLNQLYRFSPLQTSFGVNMLALNGGKPELMSLRELLRAFVDFREQVVTRRTKFNLNKARDRAHVLAGLAIAVANIDEVIAIIRKSPNPQAAREALTSRAWPAGDMAPFIRLIADPRHALAEDGTLHLSEEQAKAILDLRLQRLTALGRDEVGDELSALKVSIEDYLDILRSRVRVMNIVKDELQAVKTEFATPRRTEIVEMDSEVEDEDLIQREDMAVTVTHAGYIKRVPLGVYRVQSRGGRGRAGMATKEEDFVSKVIVANTHTPILFFSSTGMVYKMKLWRIPLGTPQSKGKAMVNLLPLEGGETITTVMALPEDDKLWAKLNVMFTTASGYVRRNELSDFVNVMTNGKIAMKLEEGDRIAGVQICTDADDVLLATRNGKAIRFPVSDVRVFKGRDSIGVRGIKLAEGDELISMAILRHVDATPAEGRAYLKQAAAARRALGEEGEAAEPEVSDDGENDGEEVALSSERYAQLGAWEQFIVTVSENGFGKRSSAYEFRTSGRGGQGVTAMGMSKRNGRLIAGFPVEDSDQLMLVTDKGQTIRLPVRQIRIAGRPTQGVTLFRMEEDERVVSVERIAGEEDDGA